MSPIQRYLIGAPTPRIEVEGCIHMSPKVFTHVNVIESNKVPPKAVLITLLHCGLLEGGDTRPVTLAVRGREWVAQIKYNV